ncbi:hypothetical protein QZH41_016912, partial [Actinostola sp. cb2023]
MYKNLLRPRFHIGKLLNGFTFSRPFSSSKNLCHAMDLKWRRVPFNGISTDLEQLPQDTASREFSKILKGLVLNDRTGEALLVQDKKKCNLFLIVSQYTIGTTRKSFWKFPGGLSEEGENIGTTAEREIFEETGVKS